MTRLVDPILADLQLECHEAAACGSLWRRCLAWFRAILALVRVAAVRSPGVLASLLVGRLYEDRRVVGQVLAVAILSMVVLVPALCASFVADLPVWDYRDRLGWEGVAYLVPAAIPVALPASLVCGVAFGLGQAHRRLRMWVMALSIVASGTSWYFVSSVAPGSNQAFREAFIGARGGPEPFRGLHELTLREIRLLRAGAVIVPRTLPVSRGMLKFEYHSRWAIAFAPVVMAVFVLSVVRGRRWIDAGIGAAVALGYFAAIPWFGLAVKSPVVAAWAPNAAVLTLAAGVMFLRFQRKTGPYADMDKGSPPRSASTT